MTDGTTLNVGSGGDIIATDDIGGTKYTRVKPSWGVDGSAVDASLTNPLPVGVSYESNQMLVGGGVVAPKFAAINASTNGNNTLVGAVTSKKIRVLAVSIVSSGTVNAKFQDGAGGTDKTGLYYMIANTGFVLPYNPVGWFETTANTLLNLNLSAATAVGGCLTYVEV